MAPCARRDQVIVQELGDETVLYDEQRDRVHRLNPAAAAVWRCCDGLRTVGELARAAQEGLGAPVTEEAVWLALGRMEKEHLLQGRLDRPEAAGRVTRRQALRKAALAGGAALLLPVIQSMAAPTPAMAMSIGCATRGQMASPTRPCCNGLTVGAGGLCVSGGRGL